MQEILPKVGELMRRDSLKGWMEKLGEEKIRGLIGDLPKERRFLIESRIQEILKDRVTPKPAPDLTPKEAINPGEPKLDTVEKITDYVDKYGAPVSEPQIVGPEAPIKGLKGKLKQIGTKFLRGEFNYLGEEMAGFKEKLQESQDYASIARQRAEMDLAAETAGMEKIRFKEDLDFTDPKVENNYRSTYPEYKKQKKTGFDLFSRMTRLEDEIESLGRGEGISMGLDPQILQNEFDRYQKIAEKNQFDYQGYKELRDSGRDSLIQTLNEKRVNIGLEPFDFDRTSYSRRLSLDHIENGGARYESTPGGALVLKKRGSTMARGEVAPEHIVSSYLPAEAEWRSQFYHDAMKADFQQYMARDWDLAGMILKESKETGKTPFEILEKKYPGYGIKFLDQGDRFYSSSLLGAKMVKRLTEETVKQFGLSDAEVKGIYQMGSPFMVLPESMIRALGESRFVERGPLANVATKANQLFKKLSINLPLRAVKFQIRNRLTDLEKQFNFPDAITKLPNATTEVWKNSHTYKDMSPRMRKFFERGGLRQNVIDAELSDPLNNKFVQEMYGIKKKGIFDTPGIKQILKTAETTNQFGESVGRYATFDAFMDAFERGDGIPMTSRGNVNYGASEPKAIQSIIQRGKDLASKAKTPEAAAAFIDESHATASYKMANDLIIDYRNISRLGKDLRRTTWPFYSFVEGNARTYAQLFKNISLDNRSANKVLKGAGLATIGGTKMGMYVAKRIVQATALQSLLEIWNSTQGDKEGKLDKETQKRAHVLLPFNAIGGGTAYLDRMSGLEDALSLVGLDNPSDFESLFNGSKSLKDWAKGYLQDRANTVAQGILPIPKMGVEAASRLSFFPDVFNPQQIKSVPGHLLRQIDLANEWYHITGDPQYKGLAENYQKAFYQVADPGAGYKREAYQYIQEAYDKAGIRKPIYFSTPRSELISDYIELKDHGLEKRAEAKKALFKEYDITMKDVNERKKANIESGLPKPVKEIIDGWKKTNPRVKLVFTEIKGG